MKKLILCLTWIIGSLLPASFWAETTTPESMRIVVFELETKGTNLRDDASSIRDYLEAKLINYSAFEVVGRKQIDKIVSEQKFQLSGMTAEDQQIRIGRMLNVKVGVVGEVGKIGSFYTINLKLLDLENSRFLLSSTIEAKSIDEAFLALAKQISGMAEKAEDFLRRPQMIREIQALIDEGKTDAAIARIDTMLKSRPDDRELDSLRKKATAGRTNKSAVADAKPLSFVNQAGWTTVAVSVIAIGAGAWFDYSAAASFNAAQTKYQAYKSATSGFEGLWADYTNTVAISQQDSLVRNVLYIGGAIGLAGGIVMGLLPSDDKRAAILVCPGRVALSVRF